MGELRPREVKSLPKDQAPSRWWRWESKPGIPGSKLPTLHLGELPKMDFCSLLSVADTGGCSFGLNC